MDCPIIPTTRPLASTFLALALAVACDDSPNRVRPDGPPVDAGGDLAADAIARDAAAADAAGSETSTLTVDCGALAITGDPATSHGARWTYAGTDLGVAYALEGVLFRPAGSGPFPGVVLSHGKGDSPDGFPAVLASEMVAWGIVGIAPAYTHAGSPAGLPDGPDGASTANLQRAHKARELLGCLGYVRMDRIAAHGHSMGAFVTTALVGTHAADFQVASHTAGGVSDHDGSPYPSAAQASAIAAPYQIHHGDQDTLVALEDDRKLVELLQNSGVIAELHVYQGYTHNEVATDATMLDRVRSWYTGAGLWHQP